VGGERLLNTLLSECDGVVVAGERLAALRLVVLYDLSVPTSVVLKHVTQSSDRTVARVDLSTHLPVKPNVPFGVLDVAVRVGLGEVIRLDVDRAERSLE
jgi:hypothetical protein